MQVNGYEVSESELLDAYAYSLAMISEFSPEHALDTVNSAVEMLFNKFDGSRSNVKTALRLFCRAASDKAIKQIGKVGRGRPRKGLIQETGQPIELFSFDAPLGDEKNSIGDLLASDVETPLEINIRLENVENVQRALNQLELRDAKLIELRFIEELTLKETGIILGLTAERVRQIEEIAILNFKRAYEVIADLKSTAK